MAIFCRQSRRSTANERAFCQALLDNQCPIWDTEDVIKSRKRGFHLPPDDFVYGLKHPKQNGISDVAAALQSCETPIDISKSISEPDFIRINKIAARLGLTKVRDLHQYRYSNRRTMNNHPAKPNIFYCSSIAKNSIPDIIHGRVTEAQPSIRDLIGNKYLHEWLHKTAIRRCKEILTLAEKSPTKACAVKNSGNKLTK